MNWTPLLLYGAVAGLAVVATTTVAAKSDRALAGILAAAPVTPTAAILVLGASAPARVLLHGLPIVAATALAILVSTWLHRRGTQGSVGIALALIAPIALLLNSGIPVAILVATTLAAAGIAQGTHRKQGTSAPSTRRNLPVMSRFLLGAGSVTLVALVQHWTPSLTPFVAVMPLLFVASILGAQWHTGTERALAVLRGGIAGTIGVTAFILAFTLARVAATGNLGALMLAWFAYALAAFLWTLATRPRSAASRSPPRGVPHFHA